MQDFGEQVAGRHALPRRQRPARRCTTACRCSPTGRPGRRSGAFERRHPRRRIFFFTRAGYSGTPGAAAYESANFPGDETTDWSHSAGLASLTTDMLNRADRRRLRVHDRHRRLLRRRALRGPRPRSCSCAGPSGPRCRRSSASTARCSRAPHALELRRRRRVAAYKRWSRLHLPRGAADPAALAGGAPDGDPADAAAVARS